MEQKMKSFGPNRKALAATRKTPTCPRCGNVAQERQTRYGIRSECCGLHSWDPTPLVDQATHDARKKLSALHFDLKKNLGAGRLAAEVQKRTRVTWAEVSDLQHMNEVTCNKVIKAMEDVMVDIMAGSIPLQK